jgi:hypothetical protein
MSLLAQPIWAAIIALSIVAVVLLGGLAIGPRWFHADLFYVLFVAAVATLAIAVTLVRIAEYRQIALDAAAAAHSAATAPISPPFTEPPAARPPVFPMMNPGAGAAAPPAARNPNRGERNRDRPQ